ncbi:hypothetical protein H6G89_22530 [Oscillatoria sp. FACHB-1407]|uniref:hypothetical protein n=1 Tax=Oscillatoria sp. FACHB-1407 TaxID=2692847 RepID=UPI001684696B|nr:hypothetical protein [Oscillatoria sp. FACHB-1407]MBD2463782.1 hypothetical protein [Oscillatoria sp. FACHB-1407]
MRTIFKTVLGGVMGAAAIALATPAYAQDQFDNTVIQFDVDTIVEFEFVESRGVYQSTFGVINLNTGDRIPLIREVRSSDSAPIGLSQSDDTGTPGNSVPQPLAEFEFEANTPYAFYLESSYNGQPAGIFYSIDARNPNNSRRLRLDGDASDLGAGGVVMRWDDTGSLLVPPPSQDRDYNDFTVRAGGHVACP